MSDGPDVADPKAPRVLGLTGGIGSGKSTVGQWFADAGFPTLNADRLGHEVLAPGQPAHAEVVAHFGAHLLLPSGAIDRQQLGAIVFSDPEALQTLNALTHPRIAEKAQEAARELAQVRPDRRVVLEAALLIEAQWDRFCEVVWVVEAPPEQVIRRLHQRNGLTPAQAQARINAQLAPDVRRAHAQEVLCNDSTLEDLHHQWYAAKERWLST